MVRYAHRTWYAHLSITTIVLAVLPFGMGYSTATGATRAFGRLKGAGRGPLVCALMLLVALLAGCTNDADLTTPQRKPNPMTKVFFQPDPLKVNETGIMTVILDYPEGRNDQYVPFEVTFEAPAGVKITDSPYWNGTVAQGASLDRAFDVLPVETGEWVMEVFVSYGPGSFNVNGYAPVTVTR